MEAAVQKEGIVIITPPYGERIGEKKENEHIYRQINKFLIANPTWSLFLVTTDKELEEWAMGRKAERRRKLYNCLLEVCYYQFHDKKRNDGKSGYAVSAAGREAYKNRKLRVVEVQGVWKIKQTAAENGEVLWI